MPAPLTTHPPALAKHAPTPDDVRMKEPYLVFAGGGTGGHLYPGLAVASAVQAMAPEIEIDFFTTQRALDRKLLEPTAHGQVPQPVQPVTRHPLRLPGFLLNWSRSVQQATRRFRQRRPLAVLGLGGYAAGPPVVAASKLGIWTVILNPDAIPGRANRWLARRADVVALQWDVSRQHFPPGVHCQTAGCPIRPEFADADGGAGRKRFGLDAARPLLVATGASQGARTVNEAMMRVWPTFQRQHPEWQLLHLTGPADADRVRQAYANAGVSATVVDFTHEMWLALAAADAVVARAGASTLSELTALGKPAILLPYPYHRDRHQHANADVLADAGAAIVLEDERDAERNAEPLRAALEAISDPQRRTAMAQAAVAMGRPRAAQAVAAWLLG